jgi:DHA1 family solute carrier family 18 vesicular amine transporter 1/2
LIGPPVAGTLYQRWGFRAPFIFGIIVTGIDLLARLLLVERHEAAKWGVGPMAAASSDENGPEIASGATTLDRAEPPLVPAEPVSQARNGGPIVSEGDGRTKVEIEEKTTEDDQTKSHLEEPRRSQVTLLPHIVLLQLMKSPRAVVCTIATLIWALGWTAQEATVVLHLSKVWGLDPHQAGIAFIAVIVPTIFCESR